MEQTPSQKIYYKKDTKPFRTEASSFRACLRDKSGLSTYISIFREPGAPFLQWALGKRATGSWNIDKFTNITGFPDFFSLYTSDNPKVQRQNHHN